MEAGPFPITPALAQPQPQAPCPQTHLMVLAPGWYLFQFHRILQYSRPRLASQQPFFWMFVDNLVLREDDRTTATRFLEVCAGPWSPVDMPALWGQLGGSLGPSPEPRFQSHRAITPQRHRQPSGRPQRAPLRAVLQDGPLYHTDAHTLYRTHSHMPSGANTLAFSVCASEEPP